MTSAEEDMPSSARLTASAAIFSNRASDMVREKGAGGGQMHQFHLHIQSCVGITRIEVRISACVCVCVCVCVCGR